MKRITLLAFTAVTVITLSFRMLSGSLPIGADIPKSTLAMKDISGKDISLKDALSSKGLLVMFSCNTCPYVIRNQKRTAEICTYAKEKGMGVIVINSNEAYRSGDDSFEAMKDYAKEQNYNWYYVVDKNNEVADAFGANRTPETFLFNASGKLVYHGAIDDNPSDASSVTRQHLKIAIDEYLEGKEIATKESRSVGCSIKRMQ